MHFSSHSVHGGPVQRWNSKCKSVGLYLLLCYNNVRWIGHSVMKLPPPVNVSWWELILLSLTDVESEDEGVGPSDFILVSPVFYVLLFPLLLLVFVTCVFINLTKITNSLKLILCWNLPACVSRLMSHCVCAGRAVQVLSVYLGRIFVLFSLTIIRI